ncbi:MAG: hypothetical protein ACJAYU_002576 [Bradymonadia bacterium]|jgi:hypothetical protein
MIRLAFISFAICVATTASAEDWATPADVEDICRYAAPVDRQFPELLQHYASPASAELESAAVAEVSVYSGVPAELLFAEPEEDNGGRVLTAARAREYARQRTQRLWESYEVTVPSDAFEIWQYDHDAAAFNVTVGDGLELFGGVYELELLEDRTLRFPLESEQAEEVAALHALGSLDVRVRFLLAPREDPWSDVCIETAGPTRIPIRIVEAELVEVWEPRPHATARTVAYALEHVHNEPTVVDQTGAAVPTVEVASVEVASGCTVDDLAVVQAQMEGMLTDCYTAGLRENASLDGTLTLQFEFGADGTVSEPELRIDALVNQPASDCVIAALGRMKVQRPADATASTVNALVRFVRVSR